MSDVKKNFTEDLLAQQELVRKKNEVAAKELKLKESRVNAQIERLEKDQKDLEIITSANFDQLSPEEVEKLRKENSEYMEAAKNKQHFILPVFDNTVPFFRKNLIFIGAKTGEGKSTAVANIIMGLIGQKRPDGKLRRILVISNEEKREDVYNRITCLGKGWAYTNHDKFTDEQKSVFDKNLGLLSKIITVVDDTYGGASGMTTTPEGLCAILDKCLAEGLEFDAIIIDYYQNFTYSKKDRTLDQYKVQEIVSTKLDQYKNILPCPIVVFGQVYPNQEGQDKPFEYRIKGRKQIIVPSTMVMEMIAHREDLKTEWVIHKSRFNEMVGRSIMTGFDKGKFVPYNTEFKAKVLAWKEEKQRLEINRASGIDLGKREENAEVQKDTSSSGSGSV